MIYREDTSVSARREEIEIKLSRVRNLLYREEKKALVLMRQNNFPGLPQEEKTRSPFILKRVSQRFSLQKLPSMPSQASLKKRVCERKKS